MPVIGGADEALLVDTLPCFPAEDGDVCTAPSVLTELPGRSENQKLGGG